MKPELTTILMTEEDVRLFVLLQKHYDILKAIESCEVNNIRFGKIVLNFANGELQNAIRENVAWKR